MIVLLSFMSSPYLLTYLQDGGTYLFYGVCAGSTHKGFKRSNLSGPPGTIPPDKDRSGPTRLSLRGPRPGGPPQKVVRGSLRLLSLSHPLGLYLSTTCKVLRAPFGSTSDSGSSRPTFAL